VTPYYERDGVTILLGDCRDILPTLARESVDLVLTDPPYGVNTRTANRRRGLLAAGKNYRYRRVFGDTEPFDPAPLLAFPRLVLFGANHYAERLPASASWLIWDKAAGLRSERALGFNDNADAELIWTNLGGPVRILRHQWNGIHQATERQDPRVHPTQKPVALMRWLVDRYARPGGLVLDPYMGSGSTLIAAQHMGRPALGVEIEERYCEIAARRLSQMPMLLEATP